MKSCGNSRDVKNANSKPSARFRPSCGIPFRIFCIIGGYIEEFMTKFFNGIRYSVCRCVGAFCFGLFSLPNASASNNSSLASPGIISGMKDFGVVIFRGSASVGLKSCIWSLSRTIDANAVFSWREYGARNRCRDETRITSTESSVDLIVSSVLNSSLLFVASSFAVLILQASQNWISLCEIRFIFPLQDGHIISFLLDFMDSTSVLHLMSGHTYFPIFFVSVGLLHFGQRCSVTSSPCSFSFSRLVRFRISWFIGPRICLKM